MEPHRLTLCVPSFPKCICWRQTRWVCHLPTSMTRMKSVQACSAKRSHRESVLWLMTGNDPTFLGLFGFWMTWTSAAERFNLANDWGFITVFMSLAIKCQYMYSADPFHSVLTAMEVGSLYLRKARYSFASGAPTGNTGHLVTFGLDIGQITLEYESL